MLVKGFTVKALNDNAKEKLKLFNVKDKKAFIEMTDPNTLKVLFYARYGVFIRHDAVDFFVHKTMQEHGLVFKVDYDLEVY